MSLSNRAVTILFLSETIDSFNNQREIPSDYLHDFRKTAAQHTRGCIVLERPDLIEELADRHGAKDSTARKKALAELRAASAHSSQYAPAMEPIPEKSWAYRLAKKFAYHDYGVYDEHFKAENWIDPNDNPREPESADLVQLG